MRVAVEMEAGALIEVARERGSAVLVVRAILDTVDVSLERYCQPTSMRAGEHEHG